MWAVRDFECVKCARRVETRGSPSTALVCECGSVMVSVISTARQRPMESMFPFMHPHLGHKPVEVQSWKHYKQLLRDRNLSNELGS